jgi:hypothetical protein
MLKTNITHKLGNFALAMAFDVSDEGIAKLVALGLKKSTDAAATPFFKGAKGADGKPDRFALPYSEAKAAELKTALVAAFAKEFGDAVAMRECAPALRVLTSDKHAAQKAAYEKFVSGKAGLMAKGLSEADAADLAKSISGWDGVTGAPALEASEAEVQTEESL